MLPAVSCTDACETIWRRFAQRQQHDGTQAAAGQRRRKFGRFEWLEFSPIDPRADVAHKREVMEQALVEIAVDGSRFEPVEHQHDDAAELAWPRRSPIRH